MMQRLKFLCNNKPMCAGPAARRAAGAGEPMAQGAGVDVGAEREGGPWVVMKIINGMCCVSPTKSGPSLVPKPLPRFYLAAVVKNPQYLQN